MEKFALLNLLKALELMSPQKKEDDKSDDNQKTSAASPKTYAEPAKADAYPNVMQSVLARHEEIANRVRRTANK